MLRGTDEQALTEEELTREEAWINRIAWFGGLGVTLVTLATLALLVVATEPPSWQYPAYGLVAGLPLAYAAFCNLVIRRMQVSLMHRHRAELLMKVSELEEMAYRDQLTGLYNRRHFYEAIEAELVNARSTRESLAILTLDLDGLKTINDEYGHGVGDVILANLGKVIAKYTRSNDVPARLGGDEYGIVMPGTDKRGAFALARRLWEELEQIPMYDHDGTRVMVTVSIGVAGFPWGGESLEEMLQWADADMYANKISRKLPQQAVAVDAVGDLDSLPDDYTAGM